MKAGDAETDVKTNRRLVNEREGHHGGDNGAEGKVLVMDGV